MGNTPPQPTVTSEPLVTAKDTSTSQASLTGNAQSRTDALAANQRTSETDQLDISLKTKELVAQSIQQLAAMQDLNQRDIKSRRNLAEGCYNQAKSYEKSIEEINNQSFLVRAWSNIGGTIDTLRSKIENENAEGNRQNYLATELEKQLTKSKEFLEKARQLTAQAEKLMQSGQEEEALTIYRQAITAIQDSASNVQIKPLPLISAAYQQKETELNNSMKDTIQFFDTSEKVLRTTRKGCVIVAATVATGGIATAGGGITLAVVGGTATGTGIGVIGNAAEAEEHVRLGNKSASTAVRDMLHSNVQDLKLAAVSSVTQVIGGAITGKLLGKCSGWIQSAFAHGVGGAASGTVSTLGSKTLDYMEAWNQFSKTMPENATQQQKEQAWAQLMKERGLEWNDVIKDTLINAGIGFGVGLFAGAVASKLPQKSRITITDAKGNVTQQVIKTSKVGEVAKKFVDSVNETFDFHRLKNTLSELGNAAANMPRDKEPEQPQKNPQQHKPTQEIPKEDAQKKPIPQVTPVQTPQKKDVSQPIPVMPNYSSEDLFKNLEKTLPQQQKITTPEPEVPFDIAESPKSQATIESIPILMLFSLEDLIPTTTGPLATQNLQSFSNTNSTTNTNATENTIAQVAATQTPNQQNELEQPFPIYFLTNGWNPLLNPTPQGPLINPTISSSEQTTQSVNVGSQNSTSNLTATSNPINTATKNQSATPIVNPIVIPMATPGAQPNQTAIPIVNQIVTSIATPSAQPNSIPLTQTQSQILSVPNQLADATQIRNASPQAEQYAQALFLQQLNYYLKSQRQETPNIQMVADPLFNQSITAIQQARDLISEAFPAKHSIEQPIRQQQATLANTMTSANSIQASLAEEIPQKADIASSFLQSSSTQSISDTYVQPQSVSTLRSQDSYSQSAGLKRSNQIETRASQNIAPDSQADAKVNIPEPIRLVTQETIIAQKVQIDIKNQITEDAVSSTPTIHNRIDDFRLEAHRERLAVTSSVTSLYQKPSEQIETNRITPTSNRIFEEISKIGNKALSSVVSEAPLQSPQNITATEPASNRVQQGTSTATLDINSIEDVEPPHPALANLFDTHTGKIKAKVQESQAKTSPEGLDSLINEKTLSKPILEELRAQHQENRNLLQNNEAAQTSPATKQQTSTPLESLEVESESQTHLSRPSQAEIISKKKPAARTKKANKKLLRNKKKEVIERQVISMLEELRKQLLEMQQQQLLALALENPDENEEEAEKEAQAITGAKKSASQISKSSGKTKADIYRKMKNDAKATGGKGGS